MPPSIGPWLIGVGILLLLIGALAWSGALGWLGRLPGDIRIEREGVRLYLPITSMILVSVLLSLLVRLLQRW